MYIHQKRIPKECHWYLRIAKDSFLLMVLVTPIYKEDFHLTDFFWLIRSWWFFWGWDSSLQLTYVFVPSFFGTWQSFRKFWFLGFCWVYLFYPFFGRCLPPWTTLDNIHHSYGWLWIPPWKLTCPVKIDDWNMKFPKLYFFKGHFSFPKHHVVPPWKLTYPT